MLSVIIPVYKEPFLQPTIDSLLENARGEIEILVVLDGYMPEKPIKTDPRVKIIKLPRNLGMKGAINAGLAKAKGDFIMKSDAHCVYGPGYDQIMVENCAEDWLLIPRRYSLDVDNWKRDETKSVIDYHYFGFPQQTRDYGISLSTQPWPGRTAERMDPKYEIDDTMAFQGSCWVANKKYFMKKVGFLDNRPETYGSWSDDVPEMGLKYWLGGGQVKVIKKTWYAHLSKRPHHYKAGMFTREYKVSPDAVSGHTWSAKHWFNNEEPGTIHPFFWLVEKFWPVPTWSEDRKLWVFPK